MPGGEDWKLVGNIRSDSMVGSTPSECASPKPWAPPSRQKRVRELLDSLSQEFELLLSRERELRNEFHLAHEGRDAANYGSGGWRSPPMHTVSQVPTWTASSPTVTSVQAKPSRRDVDYMSSGGTDSGFVSDYFLSRIELVNKASLASRKSSEDGHRFDEGPSVDSVRNRRAAWNRGSRMLFFEEEDEVDTTQSHRTSTTGADQFHITVTMTAARATEAKKSWRLLLLNPENNQFLIHWNFVSAAALIWTALITPMQVVLMGMQFDTVFVCSCLVDMIFFVDFILQFCTMYPKETGSGFVMIDDRRRIAKRYLKSWFFLDFVSLPPFDLLGVLWNNQALQRAKAFKVVRLLRLLKLARLARSVRVVRHIEFRLPVSYGKLVLIKFFLLLFLIMHWLANYWALTLLLVDADSDTPRWIDDIELSFRSGGFQSPGSSAADLSNLDIYAICLYFASYTITSVGYGDIHPVNMVEVVIATTMVIVAGISWAVLLGEVCSIVATFGKEKHEFRVMIDDLNRMMENRGMPKRVRERLRSYFLSNKEAVRRERQRKLIDRMSPGLQGEVMMLAHEKWMSNVPLFSQVLQVARSRMRDSADYLSFVVDISLELKLAAYAQLEVFGQPRCLYILTKGLACVGSSLVKGQGAVWGVDFMLRNPRLTEVATATALTYVEVMGLKREIFKQILKRHSLVNERIQRLVRKYTVWLALQRGIMLEARRRKRHMRGQTRPSTATITTEGFSNASPRTSTHAGTASRCTLPGLGDGRPFSVLDLAKEAKTWPEQVLLQPLPVSALAEAPATSAPVLMLQSSDINGATGQMPKVVEDSPWQSTSGVDPVEL